MLRTVRIILIILFSLALLGAAGLYFYTYTHEDTSPPAFRSGTDLLEVSVTDPDEALLQELWAYDNVDGDLSSRIRVKDISALINETDVNVTYIVFDEASNYATYTRTARYWDYTPPRFGLVRPMIFNVGESVSFGSSVTVTDLRDGNISGRLKLEESTVISNTPGTYTAVLSAANRMGDTITLPLTVQIIDKSTTRPEVTLSDYLVYIKRGEEPNWKSYLVQVKDPLAESEDKTVSLRKVTVNASGVDAEAPGVYEVYYYYTGISGEIATVILTVIVE